MLTDTRALLLFRFSMFMILQFYHYSVTRMNAAGKPAGREHILS